MTQRTLGDLQQVHNYILAARVQLMGVAGPARASGGGSPALDAVPRPPSAAIVETMARLELWQPCNAQTTTARAAVRIHQVNTLRAGY